MSPLRQHLIAALHLRGQSARTPASSVRDVRLRAPCSHTSPDRMTAQERQRSCLHRKNVAGLAPASRRLCSSGLRFCSHHVLTRAWHTLSLWRAPTTPRLPAGLRLEEGRRRLQAATPLHHQVSCTTVSRWGLRRHAALCLPGSASDGQRLQGHGPRGQGAKDRDVPLPAATLARLRRSWHTPRHPTWLLPAPGRQHTPSPAAAFPRRRARVPGACRTAQHRAGSTTRGVALPPLRHASAPPRRAAGVTPRRSQHSLGPPHLATTRRSLHLTHQGPAEAEARLHALRHGRLPCPPCARSAPPSPRRSLRALRRCPPPPARAAAPSTRATAAPTAPAARRAKTGAGHTASIMPVAPAPAPSGSSLPPNRGARLPWTTSARGRPASSPAPSRRPSDPSAAPRRASRIPPWATPRLTLAHGSPPPRGASGRTSRGAPRAGTPGASHSRPTRPCMPWCPVVASQQTVRPGGPPAPPAVARSKPSPPSPARSAKPPGAACACA